MSADNFQKYHLKMILIGHQENPRNMDKPHSGRYAAIPLQSLLRHTTPDKENPLHCKMTQPIDMGYPKSDYI